MGKQMSSMKRIPVPGRQACVGYRARREPYRAGAALVEITPHTGLPSFRVFDSHALRQLSNTGIAWGMSFTVTMSSVNLLTFTRALQQ